MIFGRVATGWLEATLSLEMGNLLFPRVFFERTNLRLLPAWYYLRGFLKLQRAAQGPRCATGNCAPFEALATFEGRSF